MAVLDHVTAVSLEEAIAYRKKKECILFAGGTDLMVKARGREVYQNRIFLDISRVPEMRQIRILGEELEIGAAVTLTELLRNETVRTRLPLLWKAVGKTGTPQIRNRATLAGNVANACPAADGISALLALDARAVAVSGEGERSVPLDGLFRECRACLRHDGMHVRTCFFPDAAAKKLTLEPGEIIRAIRVPMQSAAAKSLYYKLTRNRCGGLGIVNMAMTGEVDAETSRIARLSVSMGGLFARPQRLAETDILIGRKPEEALFQECARLVKDRLARESDILVNYEYKSKITPEILADGFRELFMGIPMGKEGGR